jgi:DNA-binding transcriptional ArsR family regulator
VSEALYRLRHGPGRIGKADAAVLEAVVECPGMSRADLAAKLGKKPDSLSRPLRKLVDRGLIERSRKGRYRPAANWQHALDRERTLTGEKLAERLDEQQYEWDREAYRLYLAEKEDGNRMVSRGESYRT